MSRFVALVAATALLGTGCRTTGGRVFAGATAATALVAATTTLTNLVPDEESNNHPESTIGWFTAAAIACLITTIAFEVFADPAAPEVAPPPPPPRSIADAPPLVATVPARDPQVAQLTQQAYFAARVGQCTAVKVLGDKVRVADADYFNSVFSVDPTINKCL